MTGFSDDDRAHMAQALALAARGLDTATPNPRVGCVLVRDGETIGEGFHARAGLAHAEVNALIDAKSRGLDPRGATAYVTLEPCMPRTRSFRLFDCADASLASMASAVAATVTSFMFSSPKCCDRAPSCDAYGLATSLLLRS